MTGDDDTDFLTWTEQQAALLRRMGAGERVNNRIDWNNVAEELEAVGRSEKREVRSHLAVLCHHLLKWAYQPEHRFPSWRGTIRTRRRELLAVIEDSPSLKPFAAQVLSTSYATAREDALADRTHATAGRAPVVNRTGDRSHVLARGPITTPRACWPDQPLALCRDIVGRMRYLS